MKPKNKLEKVFNLIEQNCETGEYPGAVVVIGNHQGIIDKRVFGYRMLVPKRKKMRFNTLFDLASLTKPIACATSVMILYEHKKIDIYQPVNTIIKNFIGKYKNKVTIKHLLTHTAGFPLYANLNREQPADKFFNDICVIPLSYEPGTNLIYTDWSYVILGKIVEFVSGKPLDLFARENIFVPLSMNNTFYNPAKRYQANCAATEDCAWRKKIMVGEVHDETAYVLNSVSGNAGLFSTGEDLAIFCQMMLNNGKFDNTRILAKQTIKLMTSNQVDNKFDTKYGLGWVIKSDNDSFFGNGFSGDSFGHTGFTGTSMVIDPKNDIFSILLTNRVHPSRDAQKIVYIRKEFNSLISKLF